MDIQKDKIKLCWEYDREGNEGVIEETPMFIVNVKRQDERPWDYGIRYCGPGCGCIISDLESGCRYDFCLNVKVGGLVGGEFGAIQESNINRCISLNGLFYCGGELSSCKCGKCGDVCGKDGKGCQCPGCHKTQILYISAIRKKCPNGHSLKKGCFGKLKKDRRAFICGVCRSNILLGMWHSGIFVPPRSPLYGPINFADSQYMLACEECLYFLCPACVTRVAPPMDYPSLGLITNAELFEPVTGIQKWYRCLGAIYCGRKMDQCRCGGCDGYCGPDNGCPCNECLEDMKRIICGAHFKCSCSNEYSVVPAIERKTKVFKTSCSECKCSISTSGYYGNLLVLSCAGCKTVICPKCIRSKLLRGKLPPNIYAYDPDTAKIDPSTDIGVLV